ncbi:MAG: aminoacyl-tRNA hydrolase [Candidatus Moranbacteria bacterium]|nr:aminoacyl-tRNA hydrolase [Candidatus Moranbacteria bacterium]
MKIIIGLGNPGPQYAHNRHNAGFLCADFLQKEWGFAAFTPDKKMSASLSSGTIGKGKVLLVKPDTFMNASGTAVQTLINFYKLLPQDIIVIHDDLDIAPGTFKTTLSSRSAGHNGVQDIIGKLGTQDFFRIRLGIGHPAGDPGACISAHDFVLQNFSPEELTALQKLFPQVKEKILHRLDT